MNTNVGQDVIYNTFQNGADSKGTGFAIIALIILPFIIQYCLIVRKATKKNQIYTKSKKTNLVRRFIGKNAVVIMCLLTIVCAGIEFFAWARYASDLFAFQRGDYQSVTAPIDRFRSTHVNMVRRGQPLLGISPTLHERDELSIAGRTFVIECDRPPETPAANVGQTGSCLNLREHQKITVDYVAPTATTYLTDPLQILAAD